jgi:hypothetical protein
VVMDTKVLIATFSMMRAARCPGGATERPLHTGQGQVHIRCIVGISEV